jgi:hypothetical protein
MNEPPFWLSFRSEAEESAFAFAFLFVTPEGSLLFNSPCSKPRFPGIILSSLGPNPPQH